MSTRGPCTRFDTPYVARHGIIGAWLTTRNLGAALALAACITAGAQAQSRAEHGSSDVYAAPGVSIVWGVERGATEADAVVVIRVATDAATYPWLAVWGVNPFTQAATPFQRAIAVERSVDVRVPRTRFADHPRTEFRLYATQDAAQSDAANLTVFYLGVPDTTPEFVDRAKLDASLAGRMARARAAKAPQ